MSNVNVPRWTLSLHSAKHHHDDYKRLFLLFYLNKSSKTVMESVFGKVYPQVEWDLYSLCSWKVKNLSKLINLLTWTATPVQTELLLSKHLPESQKSKVLSQTCATSGAAQMFHSL